jgi:general secretion pathway protein J
MHAVQRRTRGFTLVEVLVAMMVMAIIAVMAWQGVDGIVRARDGSQTRLEKVLRLNSVLSQFEYDIEARQNVAEIEQPLPVFDGNSWSLVRRSPKGVQLVVWSLRGGTWLRWASPEFVTIKDLINAWASSRQFIGNESGQLRTLTGVTDWQMYCSYGGNWSNCQSDGDKSGLEAVRLVMSLGPESGLGGNVTRLFRVGTQ